jgi:hypothetical protein
MDYADSIVTLQQAMIGSINASEIGPFGAITNVAFDNSPVISTLEDPLLSGPPGLENPTMNLGVPLEDITNALPLTNGLFRTKVFSAAASTELRNNVLRLTLLNIDRTQLTGPGSIQVAPTVTLQQSILSWDGFLSPQVFAYAAVNIGRLRENESLGPSITGTGTSNRYGTTLALTWQISQDLRGIVRYDLLYSARQVNAYENTLTVGLHKSFD